MSKFELTETTLVLGFERFFNRLISLLFQDIVIPLDHISQVGLQPEGAEHGFKGFRVGAELPYVYLSGTIYHPFSGEKKEFYHMPSPDTSRVIGLTLRNCTYSRIFMEAPQHLDAKQLVRDIKNAIERVRAHQD
ncbi:hypothetical protein K7432_000550 [Basidiobolus ranarum]|uniref:DUF1801 domain-containing protein n=1 Tax=Basidiobolus ranarum TaxID=34480 RepID=A0ABR2X4H2_9FUNG